jgi:hypothetical protein
MTQSQIDFILENHKWPFTWLDIWDRYFILLAPLFITVAPIGLFLSIMFRPSSPNDVNIALYLIPFLLVGVVIGISLGIFTLKRIQDERLFVGVALNASEQLLIRDKLAALRWPIIEQTDKYIVARTKISWTSWGEVITIVFDREQVFFNSRPDAQPLTFSRNKVNLEKFQSQFQSVEQHRS